MKKILFSAILPLMGAVHVNAQITLSETSFPTSVTGIDTLAKTEVTSSYPSFLPATSATWDLTSITDTTIPYFVFRVPTTTYEFADSNSYSFDGFTYQGNIQSSVTSTGIMQYGINIQRAAYSISTLTGGPTDSVIITAQNDLFSAAETLLAFPATYNSAWQSAYVNNFNFQLSVATPFSYNHAPGIIRSYNYENDTVKGYGEMRVKSLTGAASSYFNVLQVQRTEKTVDSFFLNGAVASPIILTALGVTQNDTANTYIQDYYRPESITPFAEVYFTDATFSHPYVVYTNAARLVNEGVSKVSVNGPVKMFPNPVNGNIVNFVLPQTGNWSYELMDITGKQAQSGSLTANGLNASITLTTNISKGIYFVRLMNNGAQYCVEALDVIR